MRDYDLYCQLLDQPDPLDLPPRRHVLTQAGLPDRRRSVWRDRIMSAWMAHRCLDRPLDDEPVTMLPRRRRR